MHIQIQNKIEKCIVLSTIECFIIPFVFRIRLISRSVRKQKMNYPKRSQSPAQQRCAWPPSCTFSIHRHSPLLAFWIQNRFNIVERSPCREAIVLSFGWKSIVKDYERLWKGEKNLKRSNISQRSEKFRNEKNQRPSLSSPHHGQIIDVAFLRSITLKRKGMKTKTKEKSV